MSKQIFEIAIHIAVFLSSNGSDGVEDLLLNFGQVKEIYRTNHENVHENSWKVRTLNKGYSEVLGILSDYDSIFLCKTSSFDFPLFLETENILSRAFVALHFFILFILNLLWGLVTQLFKFHFCN